MKFWPLYEFCIFGRGDPSYTTTENEADLGEMPDALPSERPPCVFEDVDPTAIDRDRERERRGRTDGRNYSSPSRARVARLPLHKISLIRDSRVIYHSESNKGVARCLVPCKAYRAEVINEVEVSVRYLF